MKNKRKIVTPGMKFFCDQIHIVIRKNKKIPGDWWCKGTESDCGLYSFNEKTILDPLRKVSKRIYGNQRKMD